ncbi:DUF4411 domain-containing protein [Gottfriedia solisilvae]|uniref:DUF4411 domain-containing protein n=1 Tax=Gottfriedia solisilvae TaxID=1516104 RepID=UPI003D2EE79F
MKEYILDTNVFRYNTDSAHFEHRIPARIFWYTAKKEIANKQAVVYIPKEVRNELEVQSFTLGKDNQEIEELLVICQEVTPSISTDKIEQQIRIMSAYVRSKYGEKLRKDLNIKNVEYPERSDARILYTAYEKHAILVTSNLKDFILYPLLFGEKELKLYNLLTNQFVSISPFLHTLIQQDPTFQDHLKTLQELETEE